MNVWDSLEQELRSACPAMELLRNEPMSGHTSFRVGGPVSLIARPQSLGNAKTVLKTAMKHGITPFFLGNGSNLLVADEGADVFVVQPMSGRGSMTFSNDDEFSSWGSESLPRVATMACEAGLTGLEFAQGIPGSLGGAVTMNAGAYGGEMCQVVKSVTVVDLDGTAREIPADQCEFGYRKSAFSDGKTLIWEVRFALARGDKKAIKTKMDDLAAQRKAKQPLEYPSAGSTFKRPPAVDGKPVYAAALIDQCGCKGLTVGGAQVSEKHAGFIINKGGATCADILKLVEEVKKRVYDQTGVALELEVKTLGV